MTDKLTDGLGLADQKSILAACNHDAAFRKNELDVARAEAKQVIQPHRMADDLTREAMAAIHKALGGHAKFSPAVPPHASRWFTC